MRRWPLLLLLLSGCVSAPDPRPEAVTRGEYTLQQGMVAYSNDDYVTAAAQFRNALRLYLGLDDLEGVARSRINLTETALVVGNLPVAERQIAALDELVAEPGMSPYRERLSLLASMLDFKRGNYERAVEQLEPLLDSTGEVTPALLRAALASRCRIAFERDESPTRWLTRLETLGGDERAKARLRLLQGEWAIRQEDWGEAQQRLDEALAGYKRLSYRRGIAATLRLQGQLATVSGDWERAERLFHRSLGVYSQLLDRDQTAAILESLIDVNRALGREEQLPLLEQWRQRLGEKGFSDWTTLKQLQ